MEVIDIMHFQKNGSMLTSSIIDSLNVKTSEMYSLKAKMRFKVVSRNLTNDRQNKYL